MCAMHAGRERKARIDVRFVAALVGIALFALPIGTALARRAARFPMRSPADIPAIAAQAGHASSCEGCHTMHGESIDPQPGLLMAPNDNALCASCHTVNVWTSKSFPGLALYTGAAHGASPSTVWPGPDPAARPATDAGMCRNCHDPHGYADATGIIPQLLMQREEKLCITCHDGAPALRNVNADFTKPYRHPGGDFTGRHTSGESLPESFGRTPANQRHAECEDCHNPHLARTDALGAPTGVNASATTLGVSRVLALNGIAGSQPLYTFLPPSDTTTTPNAEYQLCFKCHSSWTTAPVGQTDFAKVLNPANPSYHPVEAQGKNLNISPLAFTAGWSATSITRCGDCHGSDFGLTKGPHGSIYAGILRQPYNATPGRRTMASNELCFRCHSYDVYANRNSGASLQNASRFNAPGAQVGHSGHVTGENVPCVDCHITHGSTTQPNLMVTGRNPGLNSFTRTATGGTCSPTCHGSESYRVNYAR